jgi:hypothetical protein
MDYHVMRKAEDNTSCRIAAHLPTPDGVNAGDLSWTAIMLMAKSGKSSIPYLGRKFPDEADALSKGKIIEVVDTVEFSDPGITNAQRRNEIRAHVTQMKTDIEDTDSDLYKRQIGIYEWFGYSEDIA